MGFDITAIADKISPMSAATKIAGMVLDRVLPDKAAREAADNELVKMALAGDLQAAAGQLDVDKAEATSQSFWVAGWRPYIGWICGTGLAVQFLVGPLFTWVAALASHPTPFPQLDMGTLLTLLAGMLGLGSMRTYEKIKGVNAGQ